MRRTQLRFRSLTFFRRLITGIRVLVGCALDPTMHPNSEQYPQNVHGPRVTPSGLVYLWLIVADGVGYGCNPSDSAASRNNSAVYGSFIGGVGYSSLRGPSK